VRDRHYDLAIIGGGINGCGIARDAAGRGLSVFLCEQGDLGGATSSASTKLIHGGLRYLEYYELRLVRQALAEREVLLSAAPHIVRPLRFVLPHHRKLRPWWMLRLGLLLYDHLGGRRLLPATRSVDLRKDAAGEPLKPVYTSAFEYSDCWVDDARLVVLNAMDARARGADICPRTRCTRARRVDGRWMLTLAGEGPGPGSVTAGALVNAAGPWVSEVLSGVVGANSPGRVRLVKGSHIVVGRLFDHDRAYIFQNEDDRVVFAIPYERDFTLIGTTDLDYQDDPARATIAEDEIAYLLAAVGEYLREPVGRDAVVWTYSGVRPLFDDGASRAQEATRDYVLEADVPAGAAPLISVFGGKITTYRRLAEQVLALLAEHRKVGSPWTAEARLPGGDFAPGGVGELVRDLALRFPFLARAHVERLARAYGTRAPRAIGDPRRVEELGAFIGADLSRAEVEYLVAEEWAQQPADILWRRSKLGLRFGADETAQLSAFMADARNGTSMAQRTAS
jgi:glycerol-3-phosphate dehydrogenase